MMEDNRAEEDATKTLEKPAETATGHDSKVEETSVTIEKAAEITLGSGIINEDSVDAEDMTAIRKPMSPNEEGTPSKLRQLENGGSDDANEDTSPAATVKNRPRPLVPYGILNATGDTKSTRSGGIFGDIPRTIDRTGDYPLIPDPVEAKGNRLPLAYGTLKQTCITLRLKDGNEKLKARKFQCNNSAAALGLAAKNKEYHYYTGFDDLGVMERKRQLVAIDEVVQKHYEEKNEPYHFEDHKVKLMQVGQEVGVLDDGLCFVGTIIDVLVDTSNNPYYQAQFEVQEGHENDDRYFHWSHVIPPPQTATMPLRYNPTGPKMRALVALLESSFSAEKVVLRTGETCLLECYIGGAQRLIVYNLVRKEASEVQVCDIAYMRTCETEEIPGERRKEAQKVAGVSCYRDENGLMHALNFDQKNLLGQKGVETTAAQLKKMQQMREKNKKARLATEKKRLDMLERLQQQAMASASKVKKGRESQEDRKRDEKMEQIKQHIASAEAMMAKDTASTDEAMKLTSKDFIEVAEQQAQVIADKLAGALMTDVRNSNNTVVAKVEELRNKMTAMESNNTKLSTDMKTENESVRRKLDTSNASLGSNLALLDNACKVVEKASVALDGTAVKIASIMDTVTEKMDGLITQTSNVVAKLDGLITGSVAQQEQHVQQQQHLLTVEEEQQAAEALEWLADQKRQETDRAIAAAATKTFEDVVAEQDAKQRAFERRRLVRQCMENPLIMKNPRSRFGEFGGEPADNDSASNSCQSAAALLEDIFGGDQDGGSISTGGHEEEAGDVVLIDQEVETTLSGPFQPSQEGTTPAGKQTAAVTTSGVVRSEATRKRAGGEDDEDGGRQQSGGDDWASVAKFMSKRPRQEGDGANLAGGNSSNKTTARMTPGGGGAALEAKKNMTQPQRTPKIRKKGETGRQPPQDTFKGERLHDMPSPVRSSIHSKLLDGLDVNDCDGMARRAMSASQEFVNDLVYQCTRNWTVGDKVTLSGAKLSVKLPPWRSNYRADTFMTSQPEPICSLLFFIHGNICTGDDGEVLNILRDIVQSAQTRLRQLTWARKRSTQTPAKQSAVGNAGRREEDFADFEKISQKTSSSKKPSSLQKPSTTQNSKITSTSKKSGAVAGKTTNVVGRLDFSPNGCQYFSRAVISSYEDELGPVLKQMGSPSNEPYDRMKAAMVFDAIGILSKKMLESLELTGSQCRAYPRNT